MADGTSVFTLQNAAIVVGVLLVLWVVVKAFTPCPTIIKEKMSNGCPCAKKKSGMWTPF